jgi:hypothetical protein
MRSGTFVPFSTSTKGSSMNQPSAHNDEPQAKFPFGRIVATPNALTQIPNDEILKALSRHLQGDWGTLDAEDKNANERALKHGGRLFSAYQSSHNEKFWIITEADRSATTILLPEDY